MEEAKAGSIGYTPKQCASLDVNPEFMFAESES